MEVDQSLDEIIKSRGSERRGRGRGRGRTGRTSDKDHLLGKRPAVAAAAAAPTPNGAKMVATTEKIIVSNLPPDVNEAQIKELFHTTVGLVKEVTLHYDAHGVSKGNATVNFAKKGDAEKAYNQYNNRLIDGKRPMKIELFADLSKPPLTLAKRVAPARIVPEEVSDTTLPARGGRPRRGRGGRGGRGRRDARPQKTAEDLDAEMADYSANNAPVTATAA